MRVLHIVHQYPPDFIGGTELYTQALANEQVARGQTVAVFTPSISTATATENSASIQRVPLGARTPQAIFFSTFKQATVSQAWRATLDQFKPDLVHVQHLRGLRVSMLDDLHLRKIPYVITLHDYYYACANAMLLTNYDHTICNGPRGWINCGHCALARAGHDRLAVLSPGLAPLLAYRQARLRRVLVQAQALIAPTEFVRDQYQRQLKLSADHVRVIRHGIEVPTDLTATQRSDHLPLRLAYIGGLAPHKGLQVLIDAMNQLPETARLVIYGDVTAQPDYVAQLKQRARHPHIEFLGALPHSELYSALKQIDLVVVPSIWYETSALIVQEAQAARVPVLASDIGALRETTLNGGGQVFPFGDAAVLRDKLQHLIDFPAELEQLRKNLKPVRTLQAHAADIEALYREIIPTETMN